VAEKTEQPTPKKLRDARKKGQVAQSKEVISAAVLIGIFGFLWANLGHYVQSLQEVLEMPLGLYDMAFKDAIKKLFDLLLKEATLLVLPLFGVAVVIALLAGFAQVGVLLSLQSIKPDLKKLNPGQGIKKIFSIKNVIELVKSIIKIGFLGTLLYVVIKGGLRDLMKVPYCEIYCLTDVLTALLKQVVLYTSTAFIIIAAADYAFQRFQYIKQLKMSKDEIKQEYKEMEGDPEIKGKRRSLQQELAMGSGLEQKVKKSSVVVTNPTRRAIALYYNEGETPLPVVTVKGENLIAKRIIEIAQQQGIPIMENVPLAHALMEQAEIDQYIPSDLIAAVAEVLRWVQELHQR
jgi:type III secretion protein U